MTYSIVKRFPAVILAAPSARARLRCPPTHTNMFWVVPTIHAASSLVQGLIRFWHFNSGSDHDIGHLAVFKLTFWEQVMNLSWKCLSPGCPRLPREQFTVFTPSPGVWTLDMYNRSSNEHATSGSTSRYGDHCPRLAGCRNF
ncbi:hypothetical protein DFH09DRAFT_118314 [Mycena vulgaris]|nr:hypothetical protein DFH09DRAFT_118314 [Mycena vulgaris]